MSAVPTQRTPWGTVFMLGTLTALGPLAIDMYLPSLPSIGADLHASAGQTQATMSTFLAGMGLGQVIYGPASDRLGRRAPILFGITIYIAASIACACATSPTMLIVARLLQALGACGGQVVSRAIVRDRFNHTETARMLSLLMLIMGVAPILAPLVGSTLLTFGGWRLNFWCMTAFGVAVGGAALFFLKESRTEETIAHSRTENPLQAYLALFRERRLIGYGLAGALNGATIFTYVAASPMLLIKSYGISPIHFGTIFSINGIGLIGANQINRLLLRRATPDQVLARASLAVVFCASMLALAAVTGIGGRYVVIPLLFSLLTSFGFLGGNTMAGALSVDPRRAGAISAMLGCASFTIGALASALAGALADGSARPMALIILTAVCGSAAAVRFLALPRDQRRRRLATM